MTASVLKPDPKTCKAKQINTLTKTREKTKQKQTKQLENILFAGAFVNLSARKFYRPVQ